ncbi:hypothetical protein QCA50_000354 [Cerrena zonata]|uniref:Ubiquitin-like-conjugating enzyme ATG10 n=1 Tax=Cerrena zonata TaxID=2478898 RepID=A0AAW0GXS9_9APHY
MVSTTITPSEFEEGCKAFITKCSLARDKLSQRMYSPGWQWHEHPSFSQLSYMSRLMHFPVAATLSSDVDDDISDADGLPDDDASIAPILSNLVSVNISIVYSPTYHVPALYFTAHQSSGSPLTLSEIVRLPLFRPGLFPEFDQGSTFAIQGPDSSFAMLSQGDHPTLGTPSWYLHPCHTADMVGEILAELDEASVGRGARWIDSWFLVMSNAVDLSSTL